MDPNKSIFSLESINFDINKIEKDTNNIEQFLRNVQSQDKFMIKEEYFSNQLINKNNDMCYYTEEKLELFNVSEIHYEQNIQNKLVNDFKISDNTIKDPEEKLFNEDNNFTFNMKKFEIDFSDFEHNVQFNEDNQNHRGIIFNEESEFSNNILSNLSWKFIKKFNIFSNFSNWN